MVSERQSYALKHNKMSQLGAFIFKDGRARWAVPVNQGSCQTERRTLADF
jgi:hypothetical protein